MTVWKSSLILIVLTCANVIWLPLIARSGESARPHTSKPEFVRDAIWVWGNPEMATPGEHTLATFAQASPAQRVSLLGVSSVMMAGDGLPSDFDEARRLTEQVAHLPHILWEITPDENQESKFVFDQRLEHLGKLVAEYHQIEGVILDDMSTTFYNKGLKPKHLIRLREQLATQKAPLKLWGVLYTMSLNRPHIDEYIEYLDGILLPEWHSDRVGDMEKHVAHCEKQYPGKPILYCTYLYDYGGGKRISLQLLEKQFEIGLRLLHAGRIEGIEITTITNDLEALEWTANWIKQVGGQKIGSP